MKTWLARPAPGLTEAPTEIRLLFEAPVEASVLCQRRGNLGEPVAAAAATTAPGDKTLLLVRLAQHLKAEVYKVICRLIAADTHKVNGSFSFQRRP